MTNRLWLVIAQDGFSALWNYLVHLLFSESVYFEYVLSISIFFVSFLSVISLFISCLHTVLQELNCLQRPKPLQFNFLNTQEHARTHARDRLMNVRIFCWMKSFWIRFRLNLAAKWTVMFFPFPKIFGLSLYPETGYPDLIFRRFMIWYIC
jgi:hypothetical protein